jgi:hypothetical protein
MSALIEVSEKIAAWPIRNRCKPFETQGMSVMNRTVPICLLVAVTFVARVHAEIEPLSPEQLKAKASHIAIGDVKLICTEVVKDGDWLNTVGVVEIRVTKLEKGSKIETGESVYVRFLRHEWIGKGDPPPHYSGHRLPKKGDSVRVYLKHNDGGYDALLPNGFEVLPKATGPKAKP